MLAAASQQTDTKTSITPLSVAAEPAKPLESLLTAAVNAVGETIHRVLEVVDTAASHITAIVTLAPNSPIGAFLGPLAKILAQSEADLTGLGVGLAADNYRTAQTFLDRDIAAVDGVASLLSASKFPPAQAIGASLVVINDIVKIGKLLVNTIFPATPSISFASTKLVGPDQAGLVQGTVVIANPAGGVFTLNASTPSFPLKGGISLDTSGLLDTSTAYFTYTPTSAAQLAAEKAGQDGTDTVTLTVDNSDKNQTATETVPVVVDPGVPQAVTPADTTTDPTTGTVTGSGSFTDPAGGQLKYTVTTDPTSGTLTAFNTTTDSADFGSPGESNFSFTYKPSDNAVGTLTAGTPVVDPADAASGIVTGTTVYTTDITDKFTVTATNNVHQAAEDIPISTSTTVAPKDLTYTLTNAPQQGTVTVNDDGSFTYTPTEAALQAAEAAGKDGSDTFTVTARPLILTGPNGASSAAEIVTVPITATDPIVGNWTGNVIGGGETFAYAGGGAYTVSHLGTGDDFGTFTKTGPGAYAGHATIPAGFPISESFTLVLDSGSTLTVDETISSNGQVQSFSAVLTKQQSSPTAQSL